MHRFKKIVFCFTPLFLPFSVMAAGWTGYGQIAELNQQPPGVVDIVITGNFPNNPTSCTVIDKFLFDISSARDERTFSMLLSAFMAGKEVKLFVTDGCPVWDTPKITGIYIK
ncbi:hypothetical protein FKG94_28540 [Exilibacterium tricleocarpae]|uniref:Uncharacterized protein n=1 Tax=Exilibacterium tricleocarpae TaxID=2591008 RepID=A0A545SL70_9GAMM|nr:hypothetical protein [Exilibacterium tricleocarpae]TQV65576.1 hypothetical protein FKG94_28540 [Exilibacterium tricleocarpae]